MPPSQYPPHSQLTLLFNKNPPALNLECFINPPWSFSPALMHNPAEVPIPPLKLLGPNWLCLSFVCHRTYVMLFLIYKFPSGYYILVSPSLLTSMFCKVKGSFEHVRLSSCQPLSFTLEIQLKECLHSYLSSGMEMFTFTTWTLSLKYLHFFLVLQKLFFGFNNSSNSETQLKETQITQILKTSMAMKIR